MESGDLIRLMESNLRQLQSILEKADGGSPGKNGHGGASISDLLAVELNLQEEIIDFRLMKILNEERPYIPQIHPTTLSGHPAHSLSDCASRFLQQRRDLITLLRRTPREKWDRTGVHEVEGHVSFKEFIRRMVEKDQLLINELANFLHHS